MESEQKQTDVPAMKKKAPKLPKKSTPRQESHKALKDRKRQAQRVRLEFDPDPVEVRERRSIEDLRVPVRRPQPDRAGS